MGHLLGTQSLNDMYKRCTQVSGRQGQLSWLSDEIRNTRFAFVVRICSRAKNSAAQAKRKRHSFRSQHSEGGVTAVTRITAVPDRRVRVAISVPLQPREKVKWKRVASQPNASAPHQHARNLSDGLSCSVPVSDPEPRHAKTLRSCTQVGARKRKSSAQGSLTRSLQHTAHVSCGILNSQAILSSGCSTLPRLHSPQDQSLMWPASTASSTAFANACNGRPITLK